jgi:glucose-1-phosphate adenylyltransferase
MIERCTEEDRYDFVRDILIRYKDMKQISACMMSDYWSNISSVDDYFRTNMDFLKAEVRKYFFKEYPEIRTKVDDLPPAKYNMGSQVHNSLIAGGCIVNGTVEDSILFRKSYVGNNCYIKNSIILNDVYIGDNTHIENCVVESRGTIRANSYYKGESGIQVVVEHNERYVI